MEENYCRMADVHFQYEQEDTNAMDKQLLSHPQVMNRKTQAEMTAHLNATNSGGRDPQFYSEFFQRSHLHFFISSILYRDISEDPVLGQAGEARSYLRIGKCAPCK